MGHHVPAMCCWRTAPTALSDASVTMQVGAVGTGWLRRVALASASFISVNAAVAFSVQIKC